MTRLVTIPGTRGIVLPNAPRIQMSSFERTIANLPGLRCVIDPASLASDGSGRDRFSQLLITPRGTGNARIAADAAFNNLPVISIPNGSSGLSLPAGSLSSSYTVIGVAQLDTARYDANTTSNLFLSADEAGNPIANLRDNTAHNPTLVALEGVSSFNTAVSGAPARGAVAVWAASFDYDTKESAIVTGNGSVIKLFTHASARPAVEGDRWRYGGVPSTSSGWVGKLGMGIICDRALHKSTLLPFLASAIAAVKTRYTIV